MQLAQAASANPIFGLVTPPPGVEAFNKAAGAAGSNIGLIIFVSNLIKLAFVIAGLIALINIILAGYTLLSSAGNPKEVEKATSSLLYSLIGLAVMVGAFTIISIVSFLLFGDASFILNPVLPTI